jgi:lysophospholipase L1-like esterase
MPAITDDRNGRGGRRALARQVLRVLVVVGTLVLVAAASIAFALRLTPEQSVSVLGQTVAVGTAPPTLSTEGPGQVVLFGQSLPTQVYFIGPVRPRLVLTDISINEQVAGLTTGSRTAAATFGDALVRGWWHYFAWEVAFVAFGALLLLGAIAGWRRYGLKRTLVVLMGGLVFVQAVNLSAIMVTAYTAPGILRQVHDLSQLVGREERRPLPAAAGPTLPRIQAIVLGDSTAAGLGGPRLPNPTAADEACQRSAFAFAVILARVNDWEVDNLGCSGATIAGGVLGAQFAGDRRIPAQLSVAKRASKVKAIIVSVGANDMHWSVLVHLCAASDVCDNRALTAYFQRALNGFTQDYYALLRQLAAMPGDPLVVINQYYAPFVRTPACLASSGLTSAKIEVLLDRLSVLNEVLAKGAETFGFQTVRPDFSGHELCTDQSYVQGLEEPAPLHPNARGQLVIALADERALLGAG